MPCESGPPSGHAHQPLLLRTQDAQRQSRSWSPVAPARSARQFVETVLRALPRRPPRWSSSRATSSSSTRWRSSSPSRELRRCATSSATCATRSACTRALRGRRRRRPRRRAQAGAGGRVQPVRVHQDQRAAARRTSSRPASTHGVQAGGRAVHRQGRQPDQPLRRHQAVLRQAVRRRQQHQAARRDMRFAVVRYGNVMGSARLGDPVLPRASAPSGVLPITDPRMTRFRITLQEGVDFVLWCLRARMGRRDLRAQDPVATASPTWPQAIAPECRAASRRHPAGREAARGDDHRERQPQHGRLRRLLRHPADQRQLHASTTTCARIGGAAGGAGLRLRQRQQRRVPERATQLRALIASTNAATDDVRPERIAMIPYGRQDITEDDIAAVRRGAALRLPDPGPGGAALRGGGRRAHAARRMPWRSPTPPRRCTSPAWRSGVGPGRRRVDQPEHASSRRPTARCTAAPTSISSTSTRARCNM